MTATNHHGHKPSRPQTITATNHGDQLGEIYPAMLNDLNCTFGVSFSHFHCCGHHGYGLWPSWLWFVAIVVMVCGRHGYGFCPSWFVAVMLQSLSFPSVFLFLQLLSAN